MQKRATKWCLNYMISHIVDFGPVGKNYDHYHMGKAKAGIMDFPHRLLVWPVQIESAVGSHLYQCNATLPIPFRPIQKHGSILDLKLCLPSLYLYHHSIYSDHIRR